MARRKSGEESVTSVTISIERFKELIEAERELKKLRTVITSVMGPTCDGVLFATKNGTLLTITPSLEFDILDDRGV